ncbi:hypothetical protein Hanom_Chr03g00270731 [Helianthus anomalus]
MSSLDVYLRVRLGWRVWGRHPRQLVIYSAPRCYNTTSQAPWRGAIELSPW